MSQNTTKRLELWIGGALTLAAICAVVASSLYSFIMKAWPPVSGVSGHALQKISDIYGGLIVGFLFLLCGLTWHQAGPALRQTLQCAGLLVLVGTLTSFLTFTWYFAFGIYGVEALLLYLMLSNCLQILRRKA